MQQAEQGRAADRRTIRPDAVLHQRALLALDPGDDGREDAHHHEHDEDRLEQDDEQHDALRLLTHEDERAAVVGKRVERRAGKGGQRLGERARDGTLVEGVVEALQLQGLREL